MPRFGCSLQPLDRGFPPGQGIEPQHPGAKEEASTRRREGRRGGTQWRNPVAGRGLKGPKTKRNDAAILCAACQVPSSMDAIQDPSVALQIVPD